MTHLAKEKHESEIKGWVLSGYNIPKVQFISEGNFGVVNLKKTKEFEKCLA